MKRGGSRLASSSFQLVYEYINIQDENSSHRWIILFPAVPSLNSEGSRFVQAVIVGQITAVQ
jgi:hypothetical protein